MSMRQLRRALARPIDGASLAVFRMAFGLIMAWDVWRYHALHRIDSYFVKPRLLFPYFGFEWLRPLPGPWMHALFAAMLLLALCVAVGLFYRATTVLLFVAYTYTFLLDQTHYQNHLYLFCLIAAIMSVIDAHQVWSLDAVRKRTMPLVPAWQVWLVAFQVGVAYFYGGINKLSAEWLSGIPMALNLETVRRVPTSPAFLLEAWAPVALAWGGLAIDLLAVPLLWWRRSRLFMFAALAAFHLTNEYFFEIGVFPWFMLAGTTIFLSPGWPRLLLRSRSPVSRPVGKAAPLLSQATSSMLGAFVLLQLLVPLRSHAYSGNPVWSHDGQFFSWSMKLHIRAGRARLFVVDDAGHSEEVPLKDIITKRQLSRLACTPDMIRTVSRFARASLPTDKQYRLRWESVMSLDGRPYQPFVIADGDAIARAPSTLGATSFVLPMQHAELPTHAQLSAHAASLRGAAARDMSQDD